MFDQLAALLYGVNDFAEIYEAIVRAAATLVDGCDHASLMMQGRSGVFDTIAASDPVARQVDDLERKHNEGPCLDAVDEERPQLEPDFEHPTHWPDLSAAIVAETPVRGGAGFRIIVERSKVGALNLFSDRAGALDESSVDQGIILAAFASVVIAAVQNRDRADTLSRGLDSNREIGKAIGLMMAFHRISDDAAFDLLRKASQDMNIKIAEVARQVVTHHNTDKG
ncbi:MAG: GAF and ANTAR domain-containing protein [Actinomycetota bacterium]|nr:GAF and ANTAR domain-containing protein [Actinomycetota bacterium]